MSVEEPKEQATGGESSAGEGKPEDAQGRAQPKEVHVKIEEKAKASETVVPPGERLEAVGKESLHNMKELLKDEYKAQDEVEEIGELSLDEALAKFNTSVDGLTSAEAEKRLMEYGPNALPEVKENKCLKFLSFMWNPLSWVMEAAALVAIILSNGPTPWLCAVTPVPDNCDGIQPPDFPDFIGIIILLILNSVIGYYEEAQAGDAVAALMAQLSPECKVKRDGEWATKPAKELVPGDVITIKLGDIIPADIKLLKGEPLKVDQSGLTGESLPVTKGEGSECYSGSVVKRGEIDALVHATGVNTFFGKAASLVATTEEHGHLQQVLTRIGAFCMGYIAIWVVILLFVQYLEYDWFYRGGINIILVVLIGGIPIAMPTVLSVTMAIGVNQLAKKNAIVTRITAVEELAGMDVLCSDKTGTLTLNKLTVDKPTTEGDADAARVVLIGALAARREGDPDAIDQCIANAALQENSTILDDYEVLKFIPFNPTDKRTEAKLKHKADGHILFASKGAPQVMIDLAHNADEIRERQEKLINDFALRGLRAIGVAEKKGVGGKWEFIGLIPLLDPPRHDTKETIDEALSLGVRVKMITGDQVAIGKETARRLGMGLNFHNAKVVRSQFVDGIPIDDIVEEADGFGEVFPEDKYSVVERLRKIKKGPFGGPHVVGMTGDGVNDAPALKVADVGIAVADATDAARSAADMVLLTPGLHVIIDAIIGSRKIFQRMKNYATYAAATTVRIVTTFSLMAVIWQFSFPPFMVLIIAYLNDGTILTISKDRATPSRSPDAWRLFEIFATGGAIGLYLTLSTIALFVVVTYTTFFQDSFGLSPLVFQPSIFNADTTGGKSYDEYIATYGFCNNECRQLNSLIYLQVSITGQLVIFSTRAPTFFFLSRPSLYLVAAFILAQLIASLIACYADWEFTAIAGIGWGWVLAAWVWSILWYLLVDLVKIALVAILRGNPWKNVQNKKMMEFNINAGASHLGSRASRRVPNSRAYARASAIRSRK